MIILYYSFIFLSVVFCQSQFADGVLAVVGEKAILVSDVLEETSLLAQQQGLDPQKQPFLYDKLFNSVLDAQIDQNVVLFYALKDSSLSVSFGDVEKSMEERIDYFLSQYSDEKAFEEASGFSINELRSKYRENIKNSMVVEKFKSRMFLDVSIVKDEVVSFYNEYKDSIPFSPEVATFTVLKKEFMPSNETSSGSFDLINSVRDSLVSGLLDFSFAAKKYSQDPSVKQNQGIMKTMRGDLVKEYEKTAYTMDVGDISKIIKTEFGYHIIKLLNRWGEKVETQHILFFIEPSKEDISFSVSFLDSIKNTLVNDPGLFDSLSFSFNNLDGFSGFYEEVDFSLFPEVVKGAIVNLPDYAFSSVLVDKDVCFLLYKYTYFPEKKPDLDLNWFEIESLALNKKRYDLFAEWITKQKEKTYIQINDF